MPNIFHLYCWRFLLAFVVFLCACGTPSTAISPYPSPTTSNQPTGAHGYPLPQRNSTLVTNDSIPSSVPMPSAPATDFGFRFTYGACGTDILDTFAGTFTKDMLVAPPITISLTLSSEQQARIYAKMRDIDIFAYPATYAIDISNAAEVGQVVPAIAYSFSLRNAGQTHTVKWLDNITKPTTPEADRLRELAQLIVNTIEQQQKVQQLPLPQAGCA